MAVCLRGRLMFCRGPRRFWLSAPDDERLYLALMRYKHNAALRHLACHGGGAETDTEDLLQRPLLSATRTTKAVMRRDTKEAASPLNYTGAFNVPPIKPAAFPTPTGLNKTCRD